MKYIKPHLTFEEQLERLVQRGMQIDDHDLAINALERIGYYRLSAYWHHWRLTDEASGALLDQYHPVARFADSLELYSFDRKLRLLLLDALERIEIALRVSIAYVAGVRDPFLHRRPEKLNSLADRIDERNDRTRFELFTHHCDRIWLNSSEDFAKHARVKYEDGPAIWVLVETWDFGLLSNFFKLLIQNDQQVVADRFLVPRHTLFESWVASLNYVRNLCAHHSRLFRRSLVVRPGTKQMREIMELAHVRDLNSQRAAKLYPSLVVMAYLMKSVDPESTWVSRGVELFDSFRVLPTASLADYGFPDDWKSEAIWFDL